MLMNGPYAIVTAVYGGGAALIVLDTCQKLLRAIVTALRICSEALLPKQSAALHAGDYGRLKRVLATIVALSLAPALAVCAALLFTSDRLFELLLGPLAYLIPSGTGMVLVPLVGAALAQSLASSFLAYSGFFAEVLKAAKLSTALMLALAAATVLAGIDFPAFLRGYAAVFVVAAVATCLLAGLRLRRLKPRAVEIPAR
jgi:O-antigen/teichoic acid export membrane protein